jgi:hypothetical protein
MSEKSCGRKILEILGIIHELPITDDEKEKYLASLKSLEEPRRFIFSHFYGNLDILDNKTNSLIQFSSVIIATYIAIIGFVDGKKNISLQTHVQIIPGVSWLDFPIGLPLVIGAACSFLSTYLFLLIEKVHWSSPEDLANESMHALRLLDVRNKRTIRYRVGWRLSVISLLLLAVNIYLVSRVS